MDMKKLALVPALIATPAFAAEGVPFLSLFNTNFVVIIAFLVFVGILLFAGVPAKITGVLDGRADGIRRDLEEARALRDQAQTLLDSFAKRRAEVEEMSKRIVEAAREEAQAAAEKGKADLADTIARRLKAAEDQIASAEAAAIKEVRDRAVQVAVAAAGDVIAKGLSPAESGKLIDASIEQVAAKLH